MLVPSLARKGLPKSIIKKYGISKKAWAVYRGQRGTSKRKSSVKKVRKMARRRRRYTRRRRRRRPKTIPIIPVLATLGPAIITAKNAWDSGWGVEGVVDNLIQIYTGYSPVNKTFNMERLNHGLVPALVGAAAHKLLNMLGVNRTFANLPSPLNKLRL